VFRGMIGYPLVEVKIPLKWSPYERK
jgi:hypothetical protein